MAATATGNRPPLDHPRPSCGNLYSYPHSSVGNSGQQDSRLQSASQDPGPSSFYQHHVSARPGFYVSPLQPPFLQYQWPMPISYNPFASFQGMGEFSFPFPLEFVFGIFLLKLGTYSIFIFSAT